MPSGHYGGELAFNDRSQGSDRLLTEDLLGAGQGVQRLDELHRRVSRELAERQRLHDREQIAGPVTDLVREDLRPPLEILAFADVHNDRERAHATRM